MIALVKAFGDRSEAEGFLSVAVILGKASAWDGAERRWIDATKRLGPLPFRMTNFIAREKDHARRIESLSPLVSIIHETALLATAGVMNMADWAILPELVTHRLGANYLMPATTAFAQIAKWNTDLENEDRSFACVFESGKEEGQKEFRETTRLILDQSEMLRTEYGVEDIVLSPKGAVGLSMADMLAWLMTHSVPDMHYDDGLSGALMEQIREKVPLRRMYLTREFLLQVARRNDWNNVLDVVGRYGIRLPGHDT